MITLPMDDNYFDAYDSNGKQYKIHAVGSWQDDDSPNMLHPQPPAWLETADGQRVVRIEEGRYRIVDSNIELTLKNPKA